MRNKEFMLPTHNNSDWFRPIRHKKDVIVVLMRAIKHMSYHWEGELDSLNVAREYKMVLYVDRISRLFFFSKGKYFSIMFPFKVIESEDGNVRFASSSIGDIDSKITSAVLSIITNKQFSNIHDIQDFYDIISDIYPDGVDSVFWSFLLELFLYETGYIRYDDDNDNADEVLHPRYHYDFFYDSNSTLKVGLKKEISFSDMLDFTCPNKRCSYID